MIFTSCTRCTHVGMEGARTGSESSPDPLDVRFVGRQRPLGIAGMGGAILIVTGIQRDRAEPGENEEQSMWLTHLTPYERHSLEPI